MKNPAANAIMTSAAAIPIPALAAGDRPPASEATAEVCGDDEEVVVGFKVDFTRLADVSEDGEVADVDAVVGELDCVDVVEFGILESNRSLATWTSWPFATMGCDSHALYVVSAIFPMTTPPSWPCRQVAHSFADVMYTEEFQLQNPY